ncbi:MAG: hypothetical protein L6R38_007568, partial [Xanthoria sp. 2 TBL-2021]
MTSNNAEINAPSREARQTERPANSSIARKNAESYLIKLSNKSDNELGYGPAVSWPRLQNAYRILSMPNSANNSDFIRIWRAKGRLYPFYERYLIHSGRVHEVITNKALAEELDLDLTSAWELRLYRDATQDPAIATMLREEAREYWRQASITARLGYVVKKADSTICILVVAWMGLAVAVFLQLLNFYLTLAALLGGFLLV